MNRFRILFSLVVITGAILFAVRHHALLQLKSEQEHLQQQIEDASKLRAAIARTNTETLSSTNSGLSAAERSELLRLRGQIGGLRQELEQETNQLAKISRRPTASPRAREERVPTREEAKMNLSRQWMMALLIYISEHQERFPATLADVAPLLSGPAAQSVDEFELLQGGLHFSSLKAPANTVVLREKLPWKGTTGRWYRSYAFADGHSEVATSDTPDFAEWEKAKTLLSVER